MTISCGVATVLPDPTVEPAELVRLADEALYRAKQAGRNRTRAEHGEPRSSISGITSAPTEESSPGDYSGPTGIA